MNYIIVPAVAYLIGSIPFGYILVRLFKKQDIRATGSGNIGATNVARTAPGLGIATLVLDALKGFLPVWFIGRYILISYNADVTGGAVLISLAALFAVAGHIFPVWLGFRGGKGVATATGVFLVLCPQAVGLSLLVFLVVLVVTRYVSLASILATACFPLFAYALLRSASWNTKPVLLASVVISILIIVKHHENIRRLFNGTENKFGRKKAAAITAED
ncbi:MAG: acyl-phosphate glycerol 3-phosphate acyltransferase [Acidobacteria bacterium]|nr:MAG: acyl-phosphate glycerol 3-phosphate acyltransferase [Acidobacteriota bacterium]